MFRPFTAIFTLLALSLSFIQVEAQVIMTNSGATIHVSNGAILHVGKSFRSDSGQVFNHGHFDVTDTITSQAGSLIYSDSLVTVGYLANSGTFVSDDSLVVATGVQNLDTLIIGRNSYAVANQGIINDDLMFLENGAYLEVNGQALVNNDSLIIDTARIRCVGLGTGVTNNGLLYSNRSLVTARQVTNSDSIFLNNGSKLRANLGLTNSIGGYINTMSSNDTMLVAFTSLADLDNAGHILNNGRIIIPNNGASFNNNDRLQNAITGHIHSAGLLVNTDSIFNNGYMLFNSAASSSGHIINNDTISFGENFTNSGKYDYSTGVLAFVNGPSNLDMGGDSIYTLSTDGNGVAITSTGNTVVVNELNLTAGHISSNGKLLLDSGSTTPNASRLSYVKGGLMRRDIGTVGFPVGETGADTLFRPALLTNVPLPASGLAPTLSFDVVDNAALLNADPNTLAGINSNRVWQFGVVAGDYEGSPVRLGVGGTDGDGDGQNIVAYDSAVVSQASTLTENFVSLGDGGRTGSFGGLNETDTTGSVISLFKADTGYIALGESPAYKIKLKLFLQGASDAAVTVMAKLPADTLAPVFETGGLSAFTMLEGYNIPNDAVDVVEVCLKTGPTSGVVECQPAWVFSDGRVMDFYSGEANFVTFQNLDPTGSYYVMVRHRNHLSMGTATAQIYSNDTTGSYTDLTNPANVYSIGFKLQNGKAVLIGGNADNSNQYIDARDHFRVDLANNTMPTGYIQEDTRFEALTPGVSNGQDLDITSNSNDVGYFSTVE